MEALGAILLLVLVGHVASHVALVVTLVPKTPARAAFAVFFPPAGALWAWEAGKKKHAAAYAGTLALFALMLFAVELAR
jgi:hypothetical protein